MFSDSIRAVFPSSGLLLLLVASSVVTAQTVRRVEIKDGNPVVIEQATPSAAPATAKPANGDAAKKTPGDAKNEEKKDEKGEKDGDDKKGESGTVTRPKMSEEPAPDIKEAVTLSKAGHVSFNLRNQPWENVLQWLADTSKLSFDWIELPGDTLNLTTTRSYSLEEARDMINRHLLARGYSMVVDGEMLSVMKLSDVKSSLVPRVDGEELQMMMDHTLCKMSFDLQWLIADEVMEEVAPLLSKAGKISKMSRTNRLEIMDTAGALKDIQKILMEEQSDTGQEQLVKTFHLKHRRATEVIVLLRSLLGVDPPPGGGGGGRMGDMGQITNVMKQMTQQLQRMGNSGSKGGGSGGREPIKTRLVLNSRENMILAQAMPDQMAIIEKALEQIDVEIDSSNSLLNNMNKMKVYRLETVDPQTLVDLLKELGDMSPGTVLKVDKEKNSIVAFANLADHLTITTLVERLDQSARAVEVIELRRLEAEYVAGTIRALMAPEEKQETNSRYSYYSRYSSQPEKKEEKKFKVEPDIENNRLLIYANKVEMDEIHLLLQKLGEIPDPAAANSRMRVFELSPGEDAGELMDRIKRLWHRDNELKFNLPPKKESKEDLGPDGDENEDDVPAVKKKKNRVTVTSKRRTATRPLVEVWPPRKVEKPIRIPETGELTPEQFFAMAERVPELSESAEAAKAVNLQTTASSTSNKHGAVAGAPSATVTDISPDPSFMKRQAALLTYAEDEERSSDMPAVQFSVSPDGKLIVTCDDPEALLEMEDLLKEVVRPAPKYKVFTLKYASPSYVTLNLEEYFAAEEETESGLTYDWYFGIRPSTKKKTGSPSLGQRRTPTFIYDNFTSTILVRDADRRQLSLIEDLIQVYDAPEPADTRSMRVTKIFKLSNSKAEVVAQAVKDVFRDLLSANDKALEKKEGDKSQPSSRGYSFFGGSSDDDDEDEPIRFKGLLSVGVDPTSDTLVISSAASLMEIISELVLELDKAGEQTSSVQVVKVDPTVDIRLIQEQLNKALGKPQGNADQQRKSKNARETGQGIPVGAQPNRNQ